MATDLLSKKRQGCDLVDWAAGKNCGSAAPAAIGLMMHPQPVELSPDVLPAASL
jgi:hypothetical protein